MDSLSGLPKFVLYGSVALISFLFLFSVTAFSILRRQERRFASAGHFFVSWDNDVSTAWAFASTSIIAIAILTYLHIGGPNLGTLTGLLSVGQHWPSGTVWFLTSFGLALFSATMLLAVTKARMKQESPRLARNSSLLLLPEGITAGLLVAIAFPYVRQALR